MRGGKKSGLWSQTKPTFVLFPNEGRPWAEWEASKLENNPVPGERFTKSDYKDQKKCKKKKKAQNVISDQNYYISYLVGEKWS